MAVVQARAQFLAGLEERHVLGVDIHRRAGARIASGASLALAHGKGAEAAKLDTVAAFDAAVRPIFTAHAVKTLEALQRLEASDPRPDGAYLEALLSYVVPVRRELHVRRIAAVAKKFMADGRPPEGLY